MPEHTFKFYDEPGPKPLLSIHPDGTLETCDAVELRDWLEKLIRRSKFLDAIQSEVESQSDTLANLSALIEEGPDAFEWIR